MRGCQGPRSPLSTSCLAQGLMMHVGQTRLPSVPISQYLDEMRFRRAPAENYATSQSFSIEKLKHPSGSFAVQLGSLIKLSVPWDSGGET